jgi:hypothetical protein
MNFATLIQKSAMNQEKLRELAIEGIFLNLAHENLGIYCKSVTQADGTVKDRDQYGDGWNAAVCAGAKNRTVLDTWFDLIDQAHKDIILDLLADEKIGVSIRDTKCELTVNCNDLFFWACADTEEITLEELPALLDCLKLTPAHGEILWCCRKRGMRPQGPYYKYFTKEEQDLFDAAGPERDDHDGKSRTKYPPKSA